MNNPSPTTNTRAYWPAPVGMTAKEEVLETIRLWISAQNRDMPNWGGLTAFEAGYGLALDDLTELLDSL